MGICKLCGIEAELQISHVIPKFVYTWHKETQGHMRNASEPNKRVQDGYKIEMLCKNCEVDISVYEKEFKNKVFDVIYQNKFNQDINYDAWMLNFCVSLLWRATAYLSEMQLLSQIPPNIMTYIDAARIDWKDFLLKKRKDIEFKQYLIIFDIMIKSTSTVPNNINNYIHSSCDLDLFYYDEGIFLYVKMFKIFIICPIYLKNKHELIAEYIQPEKGVIPKIFDITFPRGFWNYLCKKCQITLDAQLSISDKQARNIANAAIANKDKFLKSEAIKGHDADDNMVIGDFDDDN